MLSVVIPTRNEEANVANCIGSVWREGRRNGVEIVVVDNFSSDRTREIADGLGATVLLQGPERCAQRNRGWREAKGDWILFLDADMMLPEPTLAEILEVVSAADSADAYWIPETRVGSGLRTAARNFERSFYDGTVIDGLRLFRRAALERAGGYDEKLVACEDWDLDLRVADAGARRATLRNPLLHNEARLTFAKTMEKKAYYAGTFGAYRAKWPGRAEVERQFSPWYRFVGVFVERGKWKRLVAHPVLAAAMYFERLSVALVYLRHRR